jgi:hypothetical protein
LSWQAAARAGALDGAEVLLEKVIMSSGRRDDARHADSVLGAGRRRLCRGRKSSIEVQSDMVRLQAQFPRNTYQPGCLHTLFDSGCALSRAAFLQSGTVVAGSTVSTVNISVVQPNGYFELGTITFTSGANAGLSRLVKYHASNSRAVDSAAADGARRSRYVHYRARVRQEAGHLPTKFNNLSKFRGFPVVPSPESAR